VAAATQLNQCRKLPAPIQHAAPDENPVLMWAFYRKHTERLLQRYLYASLQVGRSPDLLDEPMERGWVSSRRVRTFEDALIFVLDVERCINRLAPLDRQIVVRVVLQQYTHSETAVHLGTNAKTVATRLGQALDRLTEALITANLLDLPD